MEQAARDALEAAVNELRGMERGEERPHWVRAASDRLYRRILALLSPRIRQLTRRYALGDMADDAAQACAIGVHRALATYDPRRACFSTHVTWAMRGELQSLRHRVRLDQRDSAKAAGVCTVSLDGMSGDDGQAVFDIVDDASMGRAERAVSDMTTRSVILQLMERIDSPEEERRIVLDSLFDRESPARLPRKECERRRQIVRRTYRNCAKVAILG